MGYTRNCQEVYFLEGMGVGIITGDRRICIKVPEEDFTDSCHYSFFYYYFTFMDFQVAIAANVSEVMMFMGIFYISSFYVVLY